MSYINASLWNNIQVSDATNEKRFSQLGIVDAVKDSTPFVDYIPPSAKERLANTSSLRSVEIPVLKDQTVVVNQTPGFDFIPSNLPESDKYSFVAYDVFSGFRHYPAAYANNMVDSPVPIIACPISDITVRTSAKSTLIIPGRVIRSAIP